MIERQLQPLVSVVVSVYNRFELTKRTVESVLAQTISVQEVIVVDDGSFDGTSESLREHIATNQAWSERVRYVYQHNQGQAAARNRGIEQASGNWVAFVDNDDLWVPQKLEWQFRALKQFSHECAVCFTDAWFMNNPQMKMTVFELAGRRHDEKVGVIDNAPEYLVSKKTFGRVPPTWIQTLLVRTELARAVGGFDTELRYCEEYDFIYRLACKTKFCFVSSPMVLIDRTPPEQRHIGESKKWDNPDFRLLMTERRLEKRLRLSDGRPREVRKVTLRELAAVHSERANRYLQQGRYADARIAVAKALRTRATLGTTAKWALISAIPRLTARIVSMRDHRAGSQGLDS